MSRLLFLVLVLLRAGFALAQASSSPELDRWVAAQRTLPSMMLNFTLTRSMPTLTAPVQSPGKLWRLADGRFRMELGSPVTTTVLFDGSMMHTMESAKGTWKTLSSRSGGMRLWSMFLKGRELSAEDMQKTFSAAVQPQSTAISTISLQPRSAMMRAHLKQVDLQIHSSTQHLQQLRVLQSDDASVSLVFSAPQNLSDAQAAQVSFAPPAARAAP